MKRIAVYAHYDADDQVKSYVLLVLRELAATCEQVLFVSTSALPDRELDKLHGLVSSVKLKENIGLDFAMWQSALSGLELHDVDELLLVNSSIIGPVFPLAPILEEMTLAPLDVWGMTECHVTKWHLQSYFLCFKKSVLASGELQRFFSSVLSYKDKQAIILSYELGLTAYLVDRGFRVGSFGALARMQIPKSVRRRLVKRRRDPTLFHPDVLLQNGMPFVKVSLFRDNPGRVPLGPVYELMRQQAFDCTVVPVARPAREPGRLRVWVGRLFR
ncbi:MAG TPA: rhamnan synthesis F family protein [Polyangiaceae bacterium]|nr:rhamnan synthesis F family protein [Polyangiaceae bacterium]